MEQTERRTGNGELLTKINRVIFVVEEKLEPKIDEMHTTMYKGNGEKSLVIQCHDNSQDIKAIKSKIEKTDKRKEWIFRATLGAAIALIVKDILQGVL